MVPGKWRDGLVLFSLSIGGFQIFETSPALAYETPPPHLASLAARAYAALRERLNQTPENAEERAILERARAMLRESGLRYWAKDPVTLPALGRAVADHLGLDLSKPGDRAKVMTLITGTEDERRALIKEISGLTNPAELESALSAFDQATPLPEITTRQTILSDRGERMEVIWSPRRETLVVRLSGDTAQGAERDHETSLNLDAPLTLDPETGDLDVGVTPADQPLQILTARDLETIRASIYGIWTGDDGVIYTISRSSADLDAGTIRRSPEEIDAEIEQLRAREREIQNTKEYVWTDPDTGEIVRQKRFRRLPEPWSYQGEERLTPDADGEIARINEQVAALEAEKAGEGLPTRDRHDPIGWSSAIQGGANPVAVEVNDDGCVYTLDEAAFDGRHLLGRFTHTQHCSLNQGLPEAIRSQLLAGYDPTGWYDLQVNRDPSTGELIMEGGYWGMHVTYSPMFMSIESIHTPYSDPVLARKPGTAMKVAYGASDEMTP